MNSNIQLFFYLCVRLCITSFANEADLDFMEEDETALAAGLFRVVFAVCVH